MVRARWFSSGSGLSIGARLTAHSSFSLMP